MTKTSMAFFKALLAGSLCGIAAAFLYVPLVIYIPLIITGLFLCIGLGRIIGMAIHKVSDYGLSDLGRNSAAICSAILALYTAWCFDAFLRTNYGLHTLWANPRSHSFWMFSRALEPRELSFYPTSVIAFAKDYLEKGYWCYEKICPTGGWLFLIWALEAALVMVNAVVAADDPY